MEQCQCIASLSVIIVVQLLLTEWLFSSFVIGVRLQTIVGYDAGGLDCHNSITSLIM